MYRSEKIAELLALFSSGTPSASDYSRLIEGLGEDSDRPHICLDSGVSNLPDDLLYTATYSMPVIGGGGGGCGPCCGGSVSGGAGSSGLLQPEVVANIMCDYYSKGWGLDVRFYSSQSSGCKGYYYVVGEESTAGGVVYELLGVQFGNGGFDVGCWSSSAGVRLLRQCYNRTTGRLLSSEGRLLLSSESGSVWSSSIRELRVVGKAPEEFEDGVLYVELGLTALGPVGGFRVLDVGGTSVHVGWDTLSGAVGYNLLLDGDVVGQVGSGELSYVFGGLTSGTSYTLGIYGLGDGVIYGNGSVESLSVETESAGVLPVPSLSLESGGVRIGSVSGASGYAYRVVSSGVFEVLGSSLFAGGSYVLPLGEDWSGEIEVKAISSSSVVLDSPWGSLSLD